MRMSDLLSVSRHKCAACSAVQCSSDESRHHAASSGLHECEDGICRYSMSTATFVISDFGGRAHWAIGDARAGVPACKGKKRMQSWTANALP